MKLCAFTDKAAQIICLSIENERLVESKRNINLLMDRLIPLGEGSETVINRMNKTLADLEQTFKQIRSLSLRVAATHESRTSKAYLTFREDKLAYDLSTMMSLRVAAIHVSGISKEYLIFREDKLAYNLSTMTAKNSRVLAKLQNGAIEPLPVSENTACEETGYRGSQEAQGSLR